MFPQFQHLPPGQAELPALKVKTQPGFLCRFWPKYQINLILVRFLFGWPKKDGKDVCSSIWQHWIDKKKQWRNKPVSCVSAIRDRSEKLSGVVGPGQISLGLQYVVVTAQGSHLSGKLRGKIWNLFSSLGKTGNNLDTFSSQGNHGKTGEKLNTFSSWKSALGKQGFSTSIREK